MNPTSPEEIKKGFEFQLKAATDKLKELTDKGAANSGTFKAWLKIREQHTKYPDRDVVAAKLCLGLRGIPDDVDEYVLEDLAKAMVDSMNDLYTAILNVYKEDYANDGEDTKDESREYANRIFKEMLAK